MIQQNNSKQIDMKSKRNLWVIQLNKPSRLWSNSLKRKYELEIEPIINPNATVHIYITSDEGVISFDEINSLSLQYGKDIQTNMPNI